MDSQEQLQEVVQDKKVVPPEICEKIRDRTNTIIAGFLKMVREDEIYKTHSIEVIKNPKNVPEGVWQIEASALMLSVAAIATNVILSIHENGIDINELINDHFRVVNSYLKQAINNTVENKNEEDGANG